MSICLSYNQLKRIFKKVSLTTDNKGYDILINKLELNYDKVYKNLEDFKEVYDDYWVLKKLYSLSLEDKPFLNVDCDFYFFRSLEPKFSTYPLIAQNYEFDHPNYIETFNVIRDNFTFIPDFKGESLNLIEFLLYGLGF
jgi:hypothetical protein